MKNKIKTHDNIPSINSQDFDQWLKKEHERLNGKDTSSTIKITEAGKKVIKK